MRLDAPQADRVVLRTITAATKELKLRLWKSARTHAKRERWPEPCLTHPFDVGNGPRHIVHAQIPQVARVVAQGPADVAAGPVGALRAHAAAHVHTVHQQADRAILHRLRAGRGQVARTVRLSVNGDQASSASSHHCDVVAGGAGEHRGIHQLRSHAPVARQRRHQHACNPHRHRVRERAGVRLKRQGSSPFWPTCTPRVAMTPPRMHMMSAIACTSSSESGCTA